MVRTRRLLAAGCLAVAALLVTGCANEYPNTVFNHTSDLNIAIDHLFDRMFLLGTIVFIGVEAALIYTVIKFRRREGGQEPRHVHGNTTIEILWTVIPAVILVFLAVPTVRTIFKTQAKAVSGALQVEVIGHQWWWEFRYPQYTRTLPGGRLDTLVTANELYIPAGRTVNFALRTADVLHSFGIPRLAGTRDLIANHTNLLWFTPVDSMAGTVVNGVCREYCGASHANMKFRTFTVTPQQFDSWVQGQLELATIRGMPGAPPPPPGGPGGPGAPGGPDDRRGGPNAQQPRGADAGPGASMAAVGGQAGAVPAAPAGYVFPRENLPKYAIPTDKPPASIRFDDRLLANGDANRGAMAFLQGGCVGCHAIAGNPVAQGRLGPNLTHIGTRYTIAGAQFPNEPAYLARWIKNAKKMKPGSLMPTIGKGEIDPITGKPAPTGVLNDQQIADLVAYLQALQ
jgi:cytochrome c oxidase subunit II